MSWLFPLRRVLPLALLLLSLPLAALTYYLELRESDGEITRELTESSAHTGNQLSTRLGEELREGDWAGARRALQSLVTMRNLRWAVLTDESDRILLSTDYRLAERQLGGLADAPPAALLERARRGMTGQHRFSDSHPELYWSVHPLRLPLLPGELRSRRIGNLVLAYDTSYERALSRHQALLNGLAGMLTLLALAAAFWIYLRLALVRRIETLNRALQDEDFGQAPLPIGGKDEIALLTRRFAHLSRELAERRRRLDVAFEQSYQFTGLLEPDGRLLEVNRIALEFIGVGREDVIGRPFWETPWWTYDERQQRLVRNAVERAAAGEHFQSEVDQRSAEGLWHVFDFSLKPVRDAHGRVHRLLAEGHDITALKQAEERSRRLSRLYATLSHTNAAIIRCTSTAELYPQICRIAVEHGGMLGAWIGELTKDGESIRPAASFGIDADYLRGLQIRIDPDQLAGLGPTARALREGSHQVCNDFLSDPATAPWREVARARGIRSSAAFPLRRAGRVVGALSLYAAELRFFSEDLLLLIDEMARDISFSLDNFARQEELTIAGMAFDNTRDVIVVVDRGRRIVRVNQAFTEITGYTPEEAAGRDPGVLSEEGNETNAYEDVWEAAERSGYWQGELWSRRKDGARFPAWVTLTAVRGEGSEPCGYIIVASDITEHKAAEERIRYLAYFDPLTNLPNRSLLRDRAEQAMRQVDREGRELALLFLDLDNFKTINDSLGHASGDRVLTTMAARIESSLRKSDTVGRLGGDEFLVLLPEADADAAAHVAENLLERIAAQVHIDHQTLRLGASIGVTLYPRDGASFDELLKHADTAMYKAKETGRNRYHFFTPELNGAVLERLTLESALRQAPARGELSLHYQPQIDLASGHLIGVEALLRWQHPELGSIPPGKFIPIAEEAGLIGELGDWVLQQACRQMEAWRQAGLGPLMLAVNASTRQFHGGSIHDQVCRALTDSGLPAQWLELEITETLLASDLETTGHTLQRLKALGVRLAVDDFGTGYSSLAYLKRFPLDRLKIDRSFVDDLVGDPDDRAIAAGVVNLAHSLGLSVTAEGVETQAQWEILYGLGCDHAQGYLYSRPLPPEALADFVRSHRPGPGRPARIETA